MARLKERDPFDFPPNIIPRNMTYQWCATTLFGEKHPQFDTLVQAGWTPVPGKRHPGVFQTFDSEGNVFVGGQLLMCRATEVTKEAKEKNDDAAYFMAGNGRTVDVVLDLNIHFTKGQMEVARATGLSCHEYAIRRIKLMTEGLDNNSMLRSFGVDEDGIGGGTGLRFATPRRPRHRWLSKLFYLISTEGN